MKKRHPLSVEALDDRIVPTVDVSVSGGTLSVTGTPAVMGGAVDVTINQMDADTIVVNDNTNIVTIDAPASFLNTLSVNLNPVVGATTHTLTIDLDADASFANLDIRTPNNPYTVEFNDGGDFAIPGNVSITTGNAADTIDGATPVTIGGNLYVNTANGYDEINLDNAAVNIGGNATFLNVNDLDIGSGTSSIAGFTNIQTEATPGPINSVDFTANTTTLSNLNFTGSSVNDQLTLNANTITGNLTANLGAGTTPANSVILNNATILGNVTLIGGNGFNSFSTGGTGTIGGSLTILGGGSATNAVAIDGTILGNTISYTGGSGVDTVAIQPTVSAPGAFLRVFLNAGNDRIDYDATNAFAFRYAYFDGGFGNDIFDQTMPIGYPFFKRNF